MQESAPAPAPADVVARLDRIESLLATLLNQRAIKDRYSVAEVAALVNRSAFQVRAWLKTGRMIGERAVSGRGVVTEWRVTHAELERYRNDGLRAVRSID